MGARKQLGATTPLTRRIVALYDGATLETQLQGADWYYSALQDCETIAREFNMPTLQVVGIVAALSPNVPWSKNIEYARAIVANEYASTGAYPANEYKARQIRNGASPLDILGGMKVRSFFANIANGGYDDIVTVDGHAFNAAHGLSQPVKAARMTPAQYLQLQRAYRAAARLRGVTPPVMQAIVWLEWRELQGVAQ